MFFNSSILELLQSIDAKDVPDFQEKYRDLLLKRIAELECNPEILSKMASSTSDALDFRRTLTDETDRGCALMAGAFLDDQIKYLLKDFLVDDKRSFDNLFSGTGGLSSFSSRIEMAYLLGLISPSIKRDLNLIRKIRNKFAHSAQKISFDTSGISDRCNDLSFTPEHDQKQSTRVKFIRVAFIIAGQINGTRIMLKRRSMATDNFYSSKTEEHIKSVEGIIEQKLHEISSSTK
ncbi:MltR family transcriptional regulator [Brevibacillus sp. Leaf182]|uniref:MltR family transcriptional regulator n=1 Tax=Brevibacillus sp. Leaf182 TaxID=1736290 RepID=UPI0006F6AA89|nr:MltR family transcriptional regulator [Brevibacillus sp. Leaf182]RAT95702.1 hypothetical protein ASG16_023180 [Brevibacillus sp. Leaf182]